MDAKTRILRTATQLFAQQGFAGVSLQNIAERVGITKPSLLYHFPSKDHLREQVLGEAFEYWAKRLPGLLRAVTSGTDQFEALMNELIAFFREEPDRTHLIVRELLDRPAETRKRLGDSLSPLVSLVADAMRKGQEAGTLRAGVDPEAFVLHMIGVAVSMRIAAPIIEPIVGKAGDDGSRRLEAELRRMAFTSLFPDLRGTSGGKTPANGRSTKQR